MMGCRGARHARRRESCVVVDPWAASFAHGPPAAGCCRGGAQSYASLYFLMASSTDDLCSAGTRQVVLFATGTVPQHPMKGFTVQWDFSLMISSAFFLTSSFACAAGDAHHGAAGRKGARPTGRGRCSARLRRRDL